MELQHLAPSTDPAHGAAALSRLARNPSAWTTDEATRLAGQDPFGTLAEAIEQLRSDLRPVPQGKLREEWEAALGMRLDRIGAKVAPTMGAEQAAAWRAALTEALDDLPALVALTAAKRAIRVPIKFPSDVDGVIRGIADELIAGRRNAIAKLDWLRGEIERASKPALVAPEETAELSLEPDELAAMARTEVGRALLDIGKGKGWISAEQHAAAIASEGPLDRDAEA